MKKTLIALTLVSLLAACGKEENKVSPVQEVKKSVVENKISDKKELTVKEILMKSEISKEEIDIVAKSISLKHGTDYQILEKRIDIDMQGKDNIVEVFWLGCPHCQAIEPVFRNWLKTKSEGELSVNKLPGISNSPQWIRDAHIYQGLVKIGASKEVLEGLFDLYITQMNNYVLSEKNKDKTGNNAVMAKIEPFPELEQIFAYIESKGILREDFKKVIEDGQLKEDLMKIEKVFIDAKLEGVPAFIVNGRFKIVASGATKFEDFFVIADKLIQETDLIK